MNPVRSHGQKNITTMEKVEITNYNQSGHGKCVFPYHNF